MKKRVLAVLMMMVMAFATVMSVSAAPSPTEKVVESGDNVGKYQVTTGEKQFAKKDTENQAKHDAAIKIVKDINAGQKDVKITDAVDKDIKGKTLVTKFFDYDEIGKHDECHKQGFHVATIKVPTMTKNWKNIVIVHYSQQREVWETIKGADIKKVDYDKQEITFKIADLSPIAVYADIVEDGAAGTSPSTEGVSSAWMLWTAMALIVLGSGVVVSQRKKF